MKQKLTGIYAIHNMDNDAVYIGSSKDIRRRIIRHKSELKNNKHPNIYLQRAYNKYGKDKFEFKIVLGFNKIVNREELAKCEKYFCNIVDAFNDKNYNLNTNTLYFDFATCSRGGKVGGRIAKETGQILRIRDLEICKKNGIIQGAKNRESGQIKSLGLKQGNLNKHNGVLENAWKNAQMACSKDWFVKYRGGDEFKITNLHKFCKENNLRTSNMIGVAKNDTISHKGWKVRNIDGLYSEDRRSEEVE